MRIGVLTLPLHLNYGGILQAFALQKVLMSMGGEVFLIDTVWWEKRLPFYKLTFWKFHHRSKNTRSFIKKNIKTIEVTDYNKLKRIAPDALVVGSDQVWRPMYFGDVKDAFLNFASDWPIKRVAYAASFGTDEWEYSDEQTRKCAELIRQFDAVSVREEEARWLCREHFHQDTKVMLDPTLLLTASDYRHLIKKSKDVVITKSSLCVYFLDETEDKNRLVYYVAEENKKLPVVRLSSPSGGSFWQVQPSVEHWIQSIADSRMVVTDSFHACVFSILFHKPFIVYGNRLRGMARFNTLLNLFGLQNLLLLSSSEFTSAKCSSIDWEKIEICLEMKRAESINFLKSALYDSRGNE